MMLAVLPWFFWVVSVLILGGDLALAPQLNNGMIFGPVLVAIATGTLLLIGQRSLGALLISIAAWQAMAMGALHWPAGWLGWCAAGMALWAVMSFALALIDDEHRPWQRVCLLFAGIALAAGLVSIAVDGAEIELVTLAAFALAIPVAEPRGNGLRAATWWPLTVVTLSVLLMQNALPGAAWSALGVLFLVAWFLSHPPGFRTNIGWKDRIVTGLWGFWSRQVVYRDVVYRGMEHVPQTGPVLLLGNHYNGLVDGTLILSKLDRPLWMMAKATLNNIPIVPIFFNLHNMIFVHRREDAQPGDTSARANRNSQAIDACVDQLAKGAALLMFPEGRSHDDPEMKPFRKGAARIAMAYAEQAAAQGLPPLTIIPVGLSFEDKTRFGSRAIVSFGKPLPPPPADGNAAAITQDIRAAISAEIVETSSLPVLEEINAGAQVLLPAAFKPAPLGWPTRTEAWLSARKRLAQTANHAEAAGLAKQLEEHKLLPGELFLDLSKLRASRFVLRESEMALLGLPVAAFGFFMHIPLVIILAIAAQVLDPADDQYATNIAVPGFIFQPLWYVILFALLAWALPIGWAIAVMLIVPVAGWQMLGWVPRLRSAVTRARHYLWLRRNPEKAASLREAVRRMSLAAMAPKT